MEAAVTRIRSEVDALAGDDPSRLGALVQEAEAERAEAEAVLRAADERVGAALGAFRQATESARASRLSSDQAHQEWWEQAATVDRMREEHEQEHRAHLDLERRIGEAERLLREGHGCDPAEAIDGLGAEDSVASLQARAELVARRLGLLGKVNLLATGELESLQERHDFLVRELEDVRAARRDLREVIAEVDRQVAELFGLAFRDVAHAYAELFSMLFPGGEGRLALSDPTDPLGSGIEVEARPGGKRVKRLSLLSGGERSLAALAFLFAIFRARPSPFYLMDEVEAALDDVNLTRFLEVIREFARSSQILVVTHQKRTMETADVLYGVSMGKDGASTVLSQRLAEVVAG
jgi:chromosome segregation protein